MFVSLVRSTARRTAGASVFTWLPRANISKIKFWKCF
jgi:hypothetical protein